MFHSHGRPSSVSSEDSTHSYNTVMREDLVSAVLGEHGAVHASPVHAHGHGHAHAPPVVLHGSLARPDGSLARPDGNHRDTRLLDDESSHRTAARQGACLPLASLSAFRPNSAGLLL